MKKKREYTKKELKRKYILYLIGFVFLSVGLAGGFVLTGKFPTSIGSAILWALLLALGSVSYLRREVNEKED